MKALNGYGILFPHFFHNSESLYTIPILFCIHCLAIQTFGSQDLLKAFTKFLPTKMPKLKFYLFFFFFLSVTDTELVRCLWVFCFGFFFFPNLVRLQSRRRNSINSLTRIRVLFSHLRNVTTPTLKLKGHFGSQIYEVKM